MNRQSRETVLSQVTIFVTNDKPLQVKPVVQPEQLHQADVEPELPIIRRSTRVRKAPDVLDL